MHDGFATVNLYHKVVPLCSHTMHFPFLSLDHVCVHLLIHFYIPLYRNVCNQFSAHLVSLSSLSSASLTQYYIYCRLAQKSCMFIKRRHALCFFLHKDNDIRHFHFFYIVRIFFYLQTLAMQLIMSSWLSSWLSPLSFLRSHQLLDKLLHDL